jgi:hypothetical protein
MRTLFSALLTVLLLVVVVAACGSSSSLPADQDAKATLAPQPEPVDPTTEPTQKAPASEPTQDTASPDCLGNEVSPIGQSIADDYDFTNYEEVITWFCNGAEFEDILIALETESQIGTPAEEMLGMLADGFTWDEIWQLEGLTD